MLSCYLLACFGVGHGLTSEQAQSSTVFFFSHSDPHAQLLHCARLTGSLRDQTGLNIFTKLAALFD